MSRTDLLLSDKIKPQEYNYTFKTHKKWIDRVLCNKAVRKHTSIKLIPRNETTSDHFSIVIQAEAKKKKRTP